MAKISDLSIDDYSDWSNMWKLQTLLQSHMFKRIRTRIPSMEAFMGDLDQQIKRYEDLENTTVRPRIKI